MNPKKLYLPIGFKMTAIVSLLLGCSLGGLTLLSTWFFTQDIEKNLRDNTLDRVEFLSARIEVEFESRIRGARLIAAAMTGGFVYEGTGNDPTADLLAQNDTLESIHLAEREEGTVSLTASAYSKTGGAGNERMARAVLDLHGDSVNRAFSGETVIINLSEYLQAPCLGILAPYQMTSGDHALSVMLLIVDGEPFLESLQSRQLYENMLCDDRGTLLVHPDREWMLLASDLSGEPIVADSLSGEALLKQIQFTGSDGQTYIGSWKRFFNGHLAMISTVRTDTALEGIKRQQKRTVYITVMILTFSMLLLFAFSKSLTTPIKRLMRAAIQIRDGDFSVQVKPSSADEIGRLSETFNTMTRGLAERDKIKSAFGKFVNKEVAERVLSGDIQLGGESREAAIFFSDIRSFTAISEQLTPHEVVSFLNEYLTSMVECVNRTNGVVDKFIGDAIMAIWGIPESRGNDTENAVNAALFMRTALALYNRGRGSANKPVIQIGCGINTGEVIAGQIGSPERMEYTCIGDAVNLASRIESLNKLFKTDILISEHSYSLVRRIFRAEPMKQIKIKGKENPQQIYAILGRYDDPDSFRSVRELRAFLGLEDVSLDRLDVNTEEQKYEIIG